MLANDSEDWLIYLSRILLYMVFFQNKYRNYLELIAALIIIDFSCSLSN